MSNIRIYTKSGSLTGSSAIPVSGSKVFVGDLELQAVTRVELVGEPGGPWTLKINVQVDPANLFAPLPKVE